MRCPYCGTINHQPTPRCARCNSDLPPPTCPSCGIAVDWGEAYCFRCRSIREEQSEQVAPDPGSAWRFRGQTTPVIGRSRELHRLRELFRTAIEDSVTVVATIHGRAGLGKSRLAAAFQVQLGEHVEQFTVARGQAREGEQAHYSLFRSLLADRFYLGDSLDGEMVKQRLMEAVRTIVGPTASAELVNLICYLGGLELQDSPQLEALRADSHNLTERAYAALARLLKADALQAPLVLILDDLHLASDDCLELVQYLATNVVEAPLFILCLAQPTLLERRPEWGRGIYPHHLIELQPLADTEIEELFRSLLGHPPELPQPLVDLVAARALGNPLVLEQVVRILIEKGAIAASHGKWVVDPDRVDPGQIPGSLNELVRIRLDSLTDEERRILQMASVIGTHFWHGALAVLNRAESDRWPEEHRYWRSNLRDDGLRETIRQLRDRDLIRRLRTSRIPGNQEYQFKHRLERDILYQQLHEERRVAYHRLVAQWLEMGYARRPDPMVETVAAHHEAGRSLRKAAFAYIHAGDRARERFANEQAIQFYLKGLNLLSDEEMAARLEACHQLGNVNALIGNHPDSLCYFREMLRHAWLLGDRAMGGVAFEKLGQVYLLLGEHRFAAEHFRKAHTLFEEEGDARGIASVLDDIGRLHWIQGELELALQNHRDSLALRRELNDPRSVALALSHIGAVLIAQGDLPSAMEALRESLELRRQVGDRRGEAESLNAFGAIFFERGHPERAVQLWEEGVALCRETGDRETLCYLLNNIGEAHIEQGQLERAQHTLAEALAISEETNSLRSRATVLRNLGRVSLAQGDGGGAKRQAQQALDISHRVGLKVVEGQALSLLAEVAARTLFATDRRAAPDQEAESLFRRALRILEEVGDALELGRCLNSMALFFRERGREAEAEHTEQRARAIRERLKG